jgi:tight adherence protein C
VLMIYGAAFLVGSAAAVLVWALVARPDAAAVSARGNLMRGLEPAVTPAAGGRRDITPLVGLLTPKGTVVRLQRLIAVAGHPADWPLARLVATKLVLAAVAIGAGALYISGDPGVGRLLAVVVVAGVAYFVPEILLHSRGQERRAAIQLELADTLDQMTIAVEAGLGFESAMDRAGKNGKGPLAQELVRTLQDIAVGQPRRDAYLALAERADVPDLGRFVRAVIQADAYGVSIADVLRTQAAEMRLKRRQRAEEKAMQIPVKVIFPLILFILPTLFIVLLGPAVVDIVGMFSD